MPISRFPPLQHDKTAWRWRRPCVAGLFLGLVSAGAVASGGELFEESFEKLVERRVEGATKRSQAPAEVPAAVHVIDARDIRDHGWATLAQALESLPEVHVSYDRGYHRLGIRGFGYPGDYNAKVLLLIDGIPLNDGVYDQAPIGTEFPVDLALVKRIELVSGAGSVLYGGNALLAVINVVTRSGAGLGGELALGAGSAKAGTARLTGGWRTEQGDTWLLSATRGSRGGEDLYFGQYARSGANAWSRNLDHERHENLLARYERGSFQAILLAGGRRKGIPGGPYGIDLDDPRNLQEDRRQFAGLRYELPLAGGTLQLSGYGGSYDYRSTWVYSGTVSPDNLDNRWLGGEANLKTSLFPGHQTLFGLSWRDDRVRRQYNPTLDVDTPRRNLGVFVQDDWAVTRGLTATAGVRADRNSLGVSHASPRLGLLWEVRPGTTLKAISAVAFRPPNGYESDYAYAGTNLANPSLRHEHAHSSELILERRFGSADWLAANLYRTRMDDVIALETDASTGLAQHRNVGEVALHGLTVSAGRHLGDVALSGSLSWQGARFQNGSWLANAPRQLAKMRASGPFFAGLRFGWETLYVGRRPADSGQIATSGPLQGGYAVSHATLGGKLGRAADWQLRIANLAGRRFGNVVGNEFSSAFPASMTDRMEVMEQDGRAVDLRVQFTF